MPTRVKEDDGRPQQQQQAVYKTIHLPDTLFQPCFLLSCVIVSKENHHHHHPSASKPRGDTDDQERHATTTTSIKESSSPHSPRGKPAQ